ncbi:MAG TPA: hypothetical protein VM324_08440 [Egibacteraceae bacterium]|nr:hypothetical protein [Egibacteraceae bacterium]
MTGTDAGVRPSTPRDVPHAAAHQRVRPTAALLVALALLAVHQAFRFSALAPDGLRADLGIQYHLAQLTAGGAVPFIDFQHGWNAGSFYLGAALYLLVGGNAPVWIYLFEVVTATVVAGVALAVTAWRLRLPSSWLLGLVVAWLWLTHVPNGKYAIPMLWLASLVPTGGVRRRLPAVVVRLVLGAVTFWLHVELAVLLAAGVALYDLFGARGLEPRDRLLRAGAAPAAMAVALVVQLGVYHLAGLPPGKLVALMIGEPTAVFDDAHFGYPLFNPGSLRALVYPVSLVLPFVPVVWRRLSAPTRLAVCLHLSQALTAIRRTDEGHVAAASTLLVVVVVLAARDLLLAAPPRFGDVRGVRRALLAAGGALWLALAVAAGFRVPSLVAIVGLAVVCLLGVAAAGRGDFPWAGVGAVAAAGLLLVGGLAGRTLVELRSDRSGERAETIAAAVGAAVERCGDGSGRAWVVPEPLGLYGALALTNPTPHYAFWYDFAAKHDEVVAQMDAGEIPLIIQPYGWPDSMSGMVDDIEARYEVCDEIFVGEGRPLVTVWSSRE